MPDDFYCYAEYHYAECHCTECHFADCCYAECDCADFFMVSVVFIVMLNVMLRVSL